MEIMTQWGISEGRGYQGKFILNATWYQFIQIWQSALKKIFPFFASSLDIREIILKIMERNINSDSTTKLFVVNCRETKRENV